jgi:hypothetical protein
MTINRNSSWKLTKNEHSRANRPRENLHADRHRSGAELGVSVSC